MVYRYDPEEWESLLREDSAAAGWSREESDYLLDMVERYDLRFIVVADHYDVRRRAWGGGRQRRGR